MSSPTVDTRSRDPACELCSQPGGLLIWQSTLWRVVRVEDASFPAFYRLICSDHVREFSDLAEPQRHDCLARLVTIEQVLRRALTPTKINLASLGNVVDHLHWHVVARFDWDSHFPQPIWGTPQRELARPAAERLGVELTGLDAQVRAALQTNTGSTRA